MRIFRLPSPRPAGSTARSEGRRGATAHAMARRQQKRRHRSVVSPRRAPLFTQAYRQMPPRALPPAASPLK